MVLTTARDCKVLALFFSFVVYLHHSVFFSRTSKTLRYSTELIIYDKNHKLFLEDGDYEVR